MIYDITHVTTYDYDDTVSASFAEVFQLPGDIDGQHLVSSALQVSPMPEHRRERRDYFGNRAAIVAIREPHDQLVVTSSSTIDTANRPTGFGPVEREPWEALRGPADLEGAEFALDSPLVQRSPLLADYALASFEAERPFGEAVMDLCHRVNQDFEFDPDATEVDTPMDEVLTLRRGVCQDFAHVMIGSLRSIGLAASYVSGYLETLPPPGQERLVGVDRTHAWVGVWLGAAGWLGVDPTNDQIAAARYVTTARGRDYGDIPPMKGVIFTDATTSTLTVSVDVEPRR